MNEWPIRAKWLFEVLTRDSKLLEAVRSMRTLTLNIFRCIAFAGGHRSIALVEEGFFKSRRCTQRPITNAHLSSRRVDQE